MTFDPVLAQAQEDAVRYVLRPESEGAALLAWDVGLGKTRTGLMIAKAAQASVVLVVVPLQTVDDWKIAWEVEYPELPFLPIDSSVAGKSALASFEWRQPGIYVVGHEYWERLAWSKKELPKRYPEEKPRYRKVDSGLWSGRDFFFIFDESHRSANITSGTHKALMNLHSDVFKLAMSGTWMGDRFDGAYGGTRWLWPHRTDIIHKNFYDWQVEWAETKYDAFTPNNRRTVGEKVPGEFVSHLPCYLRMESELPEPEIHNLWINLYPEQRRVYDELDSRMVAWIEDNPLVTESKIVARGRQRQVTLAFPTLSFYEDDKGDERVSVSFEDGAESAKSDRLVELLQNELLGQQVLILTDSQKYARLLTKHLLGVFGEGQAAEWSGQVTRKVRKQVKADFIAGTVRYLVGVQAAMGTGTNGLQAASRDVVFMSRADRRINNEQGIGRLRRMGQKIWPVRVWNILARDTVDEGQLSKQVRDALRMAASMRARLRRKNV